ncbi:FkbM family methyltransferase [Candidatus Beckwithbacteria bacterium]|nr:FkbM family methyltransferase [Candidatus Beckwithbacteria bacterium]
MFSFNSKYLSKQSANILFLYLKSFLNKEYTFSSEDLFTQLHQLYWQTPKVEVIKKDKNLQLLKVKKLKFYWPTNIPLQGLEWIYNEVFYPYKKNPASYDHPLFDFKKVNWVIDAGASEGFYTNFAFKNKAKKVIAIEPLLILKESLQQTFKKEVKKRQLEIISKSLGRKKGKAYLKFENNCLYNSSVDDKKDKNYQKTKITTIDSVVKTNKLKGKGIIKMDIEGGEIDALKGAVDCLQRNKPKLAIAVYHNQQNYHKCKEVIFKANRNYRIEARGMYCWKTPPRPFMLFAY